MKKYEVTVIEVVDSQGSRMEMTVEVNAENEAEAMETAKPPYKAKYGRTYVIKTL